VLGRPPFGRQLQQEPRVGERVPQLGRELGERQGLPGRRLPGAAGDLVILEPGITEVRRPFYNAAAPETGTRRYYEKIFAKNTHGTLTLTSAKVIEQADPTAKVAFGLATAKDDTGGNGAGNNRQVAPSGLTFDSTDKNVPGNQLEAGSAIGIWLELTLNAGDPPQDSTYTVRLSGTTT
jgi:hypothetical protein